MSDAFGLDDEVVRSGGSSAASFDFGVDDDVVSGDQLPGRSAGDWFRDVGTSFVTGAASLGSGLQELYKIAPEHHPGKALWDNTIGRVYDAVGIARPQDWSLKAFQEGTGISAPGRGGQAQSVRDWMEGYQSPQKLAADRQVHQADGFSDTLGAVAQTPEFLPSFLAEQAPSFLGPLAVAKAGAGAGLGAKGLAGLALGSNSIMEAGGAADEIGQQIDQLSDEDLVGRSPMFRAAISAGATPEQARQEIKITAQRAGAAFAAGVAALAGKVMKTGELAADVVSGKLGARGGNLLAGALGGAAREGGEEVLTEGGAQLGSNLAIQQTADQYRDPAEGVGSAAALGLVGGASMGGPMGAIGSRKKQIPTNDPGGMSLDEAVGEDVPVLTDQVQTLAGALPHIKDETLYGAPGGELIDGVEYQNLDLIKGNLEREAETAWQAERAQYPGGRGMYEQRQPMPPQPAVAPDIEQEQIAADPDLEAAEPVSQIDEVAHEAATSPLNDLPDPTPAQKEAGNYRKGHVKIQGLDISIENPAGSKRSGVSPDGTEWETEMASHYGYVRRTEGADGDQVDVFVGGNPDSQTVFVVDQINQDGTFDEHKALLGFDTAEEADAGYHANYSEGWTGKGAITEMSMDQFKDWLKNGDTKKPIQYAEPVTEGRGIEELNANLVALRKQARRSGWTSELVAERKRLESSIAELSPEPAVEHAPAIAPPSVKAKPKPEKRSKPAPEVVAEALRADGREAIAAQESDAAADAIEVSVPDVVKTRRGTTFKSLNAASQFAKKHGYADTHTPRPASDFEPGDSGFVLARTVPAKPEERTTKPAAKEQAKEKPQPKAVEQKKPARGKKDARPDWAKELGLNVGDRLTFARDYFYAKGTLEVDQIYNNEVWLVRPGTRSSTSLTTKQIKRAFASGIATRAEKEPTTSNDAAPEPQPVQPDATEPPSAQPESLQKLEDFGEKLEGGRKGVKHSLNDELSDKDLANMPLSKIWPSSEIDAIEDQDLAAFAFALRAEIPTKPQKKYRVDAWVSKVKAVRDLAAMALDGRLSQDELFTQMADRHLAQLAHKIQVLQRIDRPDWKRVEHVHVFPDAYRPDENGKRIAAPFAQIEVDGKQRQILGAKSVDEVLSHVLEILGTESKVSRFKFSVWSSRATGKFFIAKDGDKDKHPLAEFDSSKAATAYLASNHDELVKAWDKVKESENVKRADLRTKTNRQRHGKDYRNGKDVDADTFQEAFGFRGVEFGEWVAQGKSGRDRQGMLNEIYDALLDLAGIIGVPPRAMSLDGSMGLALGARGRGSASAHYEPDTIVINLTKTKGAGSLAHEWFHALDNYFARRRGGEIPIGRGENAQDEYRNNNFITHRPSAMMRLKGRPDTKLTVQEWEKRVDSTTREGSYHHPDSWELDPDHPAGVRSEVEQAFTDLVNVLTDSPMAKRAKSLDTSPRGYWGRTLEVAARAFENFVIDKMMKQGFHNDYLANVVPIERFARNPNRYPYLLPEELAPVSDAFETLFNTVQTRETERGVAFFSPAEGESKRPQFPPFSDKVDEVLDGKHPLRQAIFIERTPQVLQMLGMRPLPLVTNGKVIDKLHFAHFLPRRTIKNLPEQIADPVMIIDSDTHTGNELVVVLDEFVGGKPVIAVIKPDGNINRIPVNFVVTALPKDKGYKIVDWIKEGKLRYINKKKSPSWSTTAGLQLPGVVQSTKGSKSRVLTEQDLVKRSDGQFEAGSAVEAVTGTTKAQVEQWIAPVVAAWGNLAPRVRVAQSMKDLPQDISGQAREVLRTGRFKAVQVNDLVYLVADEMPNRVAALKSLAHETRAHWGMRIKEDGEYQAAIERINWASRNNKYLRGLRQEVLTELKPDQQTEDRVAEEVLAKVAEDMETGRPVTDFVQRLVTRFFNAVRNALRQMGFRVPWSTTELKALVLDHDMLLRANEQRKPPKDQGIDTPFFQPDGSTREDPTVIAGRFDEALQKGAETAFDRAKDWLASTSVVDPSKRGYLMALTLRQLADIGKHILPQIKQYYDVVQRIQTERNIMAERAATIAEDWQKWAAKNRRTAEKLHDLMHEATIEQVDPSEGFVSMRDHLEARVKVIMEQLKTLSGESTGSGKKLKPKDDGGRGSQMKRQLFDEMKKLRMQIKAEPVRSAAHKRLQPRWNALSPEAKAMYARVRDEYKARHEKFKRIMVARIMKAEMTEKARKEMLARLRYEFESQELTGPYFPLARFGRYWLESVDDDGQRAFLTFESEAEQARAAKNLEQAGFPVKKGHMLDNNREVSGASLGFINDLVRLVEDSDLVDTKAAGIMDDIYQLYLQNLPDRSMRKNFIHRKAVKGYTQNAIRAYAENMMKGAYQLARLSHVDTLSELMEDMKKDAKQGDNQKARLYNEMVARHEWVMSPTHSAGAQKLTSLGFVYMLGLSPAAAAINMLQVPVVAAPVLGSKFGFARTARELTQASGQFSVKTGGINPKKMSEAEQLAMREWIEMGVIDQTRAHDLAGLAEGAGYNYNPKQEKAMRAVSYLFHQAEKFNREVTALAAYRMAIDKGMPHGQAVKVAAELTVDAHFDYSNVNRARFMQAGWQKVAFQFKNYSQHMTYYLVRNFYQSIKGATPKERAEARKQLGGTLFITALLAGVNGLPMWAAYSALEAFKDDEDEPFDSEAELQAWLEDAFGKDVAQYVMYGAGGAGLSGRISLDGLWIRDANRDLEGDEAWAHFARQATGPVIGGVFVSALQGMSDMNRGQYWTGLEKMVPKVFKDVSKAVRYEQEGVTNSVGNEIVPRDQLSWNGIILQGMGLADSDAMMQYAENATQRTYMSRIQKRRSYLAMQYYMAVNDGDAEDLQEIVSAINTFNEKNPRNRLSAAALRRSMKARRRAARETENGLRLSRGYRYLRDELGFAN